MPLKLVNQFLFETLLSLLVFFYLIFNPVFFSTPVFLILGSFGLFAFIFTLKVIKKIHPFYLIAFFTLMVLLQKVMPWQVYLILSFLLIFGYVYLYRTKRLEVDKPTLKRLARGYLSIAVLLPISLIISESLTNQISNKFLSIESDRFQKNLESQYKSLGDQSSLFENDIFIGQLLSQQKYSELSGYIQNLTVAKNLSYFFITDNDGRIIASPLNRLLGHEFDSQYYLLGEGNYFGSESNFSFMVRPSSITHNNQRIGTVYFGYLVKDEKLKELREGLSSTIMISDLNRKKGLINTTELDLKADVKSSVSFYSISDKEYVGLSIPINKGAFITFLSGIEFYSGLNKIVKITLLTICLLLLILLLMTKGFSFKKLNFYKLNQESMAILFLGLLIAYSLMAKSTTQEPASIEVNNTLEQKSFFLLKTDNHYAKKGDEILLVVDLRVSSPSFFRSVIQYDQEKTEFLGLTKGNACLGDLIYRNRDDGGEVVIECEKPSNSDERIAVVSLKTKESGFIEFKSSSQSLVIFKDNLSLNEKIPNKVNILIY